MVQRLGSAFVFFLLTAAVGAWLWLGLAERHIASRMRPPVFGSPKQVASDFAFETLDGKPKHLSDLRGKVVLVDLWGTWCIQCVVEMPKLQKLYSHFRNDPQVRFLVISRMDSPARVRAYAKQNGFDLPFYTMADSDIPQSMQFNQFPSTFLFAKDGSLMAEHAGAADWSDPSVITFMDSLRDR